MAYIESYLCTRGGQANPLFWRLAYALSEILVKVYVFTRSVSKEPKSGK
jgi:hypothetical protein